MGNIHSIEHWLIAIGLPYSLINTDISNVAASDDIFILPGVANSIDYLHGLKKFKNLYNQIKSKRFEKVVAICAGFQVLCETVEEDFRKEQGLELIPAISSDKNLYLFNNGWGSTDIIKNIKISDQIRRGVYFNHSCGIFPKYKSGSFELHDRGFAISYVTQNIIGMQFHPEKSGDFGIEIGKHVFNV